MADLLVSLLLTWLGATPKAKIGYNFTTLVINDNQFKFYTKDINIIMSYFGDRVTHVEYLSN